AGSRAGILHGHAGVRDRLEAAERRGIAVDGVTRSGGGQCADRIAGSSEDGLRGTTSGPFSFRRAERTGRARRKTNGSAEVEARHDRPRINSSASIDRRYQEVAAATASDPRKEQRHVARGIPGMNLNPEHIPMIRTGT